MTTSRTLYQFYATGLIYSICDGKERYMVLCLPQANYNNIFFWGKMYFQLVFCR